MGRPLGLPHLCSPHHKDKDSPQPAPSPSPHRPPAPEAFSESPHGRGPQDTSLHSQPLPLRRVPPPTFQEHTGHPTHQ